MPGGEGDPAIARVESDQWFIRCPAGDLDPVVGSGGDEVVPVRHPVIDKRQVDPFAGLFLEGATGFPDGHRVLINVPLPRRFAVGCPVLRHWPVPDQCRRRDHRPFWSFKDFTSRDGSSVDRALLLDVGLGEVVTETILAAPTPGTGGVLHAVVADPSVRHTGFPGDLDLHTVAAEATHIVIPRLGQRPGLAQLHPNLVVAAVARAVRVCPCRHVPRRAAVAATLASLPTRVDISRVVVPEALQHQLVGAPTELLDVLHRAVDGPPRPVTPLRPRPVRGDELQDRFALGDIGDDYVRVPLPGYPHRLTFAVPPVTVVALGDQFRLMPGKATPHKLPHHLMLAVAGLFVARIGFLVRLTDDDVVAIDLQVLLAEPPPRTAQVGDEGLGGAVADRGDVFGSQRRHRRSGILRRHTPDVAVQGDDVSGGTDHRCRHGRVAPTSVATVSRIETISSRTSCRRPFNASTFAPRFAGSSL